MKQNYNPLSNTWHKINSKTWETKYLQMYSTAGIHNISKNLHLEGWIVEIHGSDIKSIDKQFKTKKQALKYAKSYMRSH